jgi:hypothetical protein
MVALKCRKIARLARVIVDGVDGNNWAGAPRIARYKSRSVRVRAPVAAFLRSFAVLCVPLRDEATSRPGSIG